MRAVCYLQVAERARPVSRLRRATGATPSCPTPYSALSPETTDSLGFFHPSKRPYRFTILIFISLLVLGSYFAYDSIGALATTLIEALHLDRSTIGNLYTAYSVAAIAIVFFGGMLYDKLGPRRASLLFCSLCSARRSHRGHGQYQVAALRRGLIFGAGSESLIVVQSAIISRWFKGKEMALAFGIALTISRVGTLFSFNTEELIAQYSGSYRMALWAAAGFCLFSVLCNLVFVAMDLPRGEGAGASQTGGRRQDRLLRHQEVLVLLLVRRPALRHLLQRHLPLHGPGHGHVPRQVGHPAGESRAQADSWPRSSTTSSTCSPRRRESPASSSSRP